MPSTYSPSLRLELIGSGEQSGTWGTTTNTNLGTLLEQSIVGVQAITMFDVNYTLSNYNGVSDEARQAVLVVSGTNAAIRDVIAPLVAKTYTIKNNTTGGFAINIKAATGSSVSIPNGATSIVYCDGTNFNLAVNQTSVAAGTGLSAATVGATTTISFGPLSSATLATALTDETGSGANVFATSPTLVTPALGTPTTLVGTNITGTATAFTASNVTTNANLTGGVTSVGNAATVVTNANLTGGVTSVGNAATVVTNANLTGAVTSVGNTSSLGSFTSANLAGALTDETGSGRAVFATSPTLTSPTLTSPTLTSPVISGTPSGVGVLTSSSVQGLSPNSSINFTSIPSWVKRITVNYIGLSTNGTAPPLIQLGYGATTYLTSGYVGATDMFQSTPSATLLSTGINLTGNIAAASEVYQGCLTLTLMGTNSWVGVLLGSSTTTARLCFTSSTIDVPSTLTAIRFYINGTQIFDGGYANIMYE